jgi:hypothetical protein
MVPTTHTQGSKVEAGEWKIPFLLKASSACTSSHLLSRTDSHGLGVRKAGGKRHQEIGAVFVLK